MKNQKLISIILVLVLLLNIIPNIFAYAYEYKYNIIASYSGNMDDTLDISFDIYSMYEGTFEGHLYMDDTDDVLDIDKNVTGTVRFYYDHYVCFCEFKTKWLFVTYNSNVTITVYPFEGVAYCDGGGEGWLFTIREVELEGTTHEYYNKFLTYSDIDMNMCVDLSEAVYADKEKVSSNIETVIKEYCGDITNLKIEKYNYDIENKDLAPYVILRKENEDGSLDLIVSVQGTKEEKWISNTEITGETYDSNEKTHIGFINAEASIKDGILDYYTNNCNGYGKVNLIITGHSRGAAVANLYAKDATDVIDGELHDSKIPIFVTVTAYTFACPNVAKYNNRMNQYTNIYNFWFESDIIPMLPSINPTEGWNYWKYGSNRIMYLTSVYECTFTPKWERDDDFLYYSGPINSNIKKELSVALMQWPTVESYYSHNLFSLNNLIPKSLFEVARDITYILSPSQRVLGIAGVNDLLDYPSLSPLVLFGLTNFLTIKKSHSRKTYKEVINKYGSAYFSKYYYEEFANSFENRQVVLNDAEDDNNSVVNYDISEINALKQFAQLDNNIQKLGWDLNVPSDWSGVVWDSDGHVVSLDFTYKWLTGTLDCSLFTHLQLLNLYANSLTNIIIGTNSNLISLNCNYNNLSQNGLDLTNCPNLEELYCDGCNLNTINLSNLNNLEVLSCSVNNLTDLNISNNLNLNYISCAYNYFDLCEGSTLYTMLSSCFSGNDAYINCYPQQLPDNAAVNQNEMQALRAFAEIGNNNDILNWLDDDGNVLINKIKNNVYWEKDGEQYRIVAINIGGLNVEGVFDVSPCNKLEALYCDNTNITSLNISGCTSLEVLNCECSRIETLLLPSNIGSSTSRLNHIYCEYNYIDTNIFTNDIINQIESNKSYELEYLNQRGDSTALQAAMSFAKALKAEDYSEDSYGALKELLDYCDCYDFDNLCISQNEIDNLTADILTAIYNLKAYFNVNVGVSNGSLSIAYDDETSNDSGTYSILYGTAVTLNATADNDCTFVGWYDTVSNRYLSNDAQYSFKVDSNINLKAVIIPNGFATLTFANYSNWIAGTITKTTTEWAELTSIEDLLPNVPYRYGYSNGRWVYNDSAVLALLQSGQDVNIGAEYDEDNASFPTPRVAVDKPVLDLYYNYDSDNLVGSFVMAAGFPEDIEVESVGIAFYYEKANQFDPTDNFTLLLNNKMLVGRFNTDDLKDIYITNMNKMTSKYNWAARGYVTYYDENNNLVTVYSNQINVIDTRNADEIHSDSLPPDIV